MEKMKRVLELGQFVNIPDSYRKCSVCMIYKHRDEYCRGYDGILKDQLQRTNCQKCYETPSSEWDEIKRQALLQEENICEAANLEIAIQKLNEHCVSVKEMIEALQQLPENALLYFKDTGYYSDPIISKKNLTDKALEPILDEINVFQIKNS